MKTPKKCQLFITFFFLSMALFSQQGINYKALIKNGDNVVASQNITIQFQILKGVSMTNVYQETHIPTTDANGIVIINIGEGTPDSGSYANIDWGSDDHFLNVQVNTGSGLTDMGTTQFMAVPYALSAANAASKINDLSDAKSDADGTNDGSSIFIGVEAGLNDDATNNRNAGVGFNALHNNTSGYSNTALGASTLYNNTIGTSNTAIGDEALFNNISGTDNTATGDQALYSNTTGYSNTANGYFTLFNNTGGYDNVAMGFKSLFSNTTGFRNTAVGFDALNKNSTGTENTANGYQAGFNSLGNLNVFIGSKSGFNETGSNKLYIENSDANADTALIYGEFGADNSTANNILRTNSEFQIGNPANTGYSFPLQDGIANEVLQTDGNGSLSWNANTQYWSENGSNNVFTLNMVGIGTDSPTEALEIYKASGDVKEIIESGNGDADLHIKATGTNSPGISFYDNGVFGGSLGYDSVNDYFFIYEGGSFAFKNGDFGIGTVNPSTKLQIVGGTDASLADGSGYLVLGNEFNPNVVIDENEIMARNNGGVSTLYLQNNGGDLSVGGNVVHSSDRRLKHDIETMPYGLNEILKLQPKSYNWKNREQKYKSLGLIAQDVQTIIKEIVHIGEDENKTLSLSYTEFIPVLIKAIQEQQEIIDRLQKQLETSENKQQGFHQRLKALETNHNPTKS